MSSRDNNILGQSPPFTQKEGKSDLAIFKRRVSYISNQHN